MPSLSGGMKIVAAIHSSEGIVKILDSIFRVAAQPLKKFSRDLLFPSRHFSAGAHRFSTCARRFYLPRTVFRELSPLTKVSGGILPLSPFLDALSPLKTFFRRFSVSLSPFSSELFALQNVLSDFLFPSSSFSVRFCC